MNFNFRFERRAFLARLWPLLAAGADPVGAAAVLTRGAATVERGTSAGISLQAVRGRDSNSSSPTCSAVESLTRFDSEGLPDPDSTLVRVERGIPARRASSAWLQAFFLRISATLRARLAAADSCWSMVLTPGGLRSGV